MAKIKKLLINGKRKTKAKKPKTVLRRTPKKKGTIQMKKNAAPRKKTAHRKAAKRNPARVLALVKPNPRTKRRRRIRRNPGLFSSVSGVVKTGLLTLTGLEITRQLPQMLLADQNTGLMGYAANAATIAAASFAASKFISKDAGAAVAVGGVVYLLDRLLTEQFSAAGNLLSLSGLGDYQAHVRSTPRVPGMSGIRPAAFASPVTYDIKGNPQVPDYITAGVRASLPPAPPQSNLSGARRIA